MGNCVSKWLKKRRNEDIPHVPIFNNPIAFRQWAGRRRPEPLIVYVPVPEDNVRDKKAYETANSLRANCIVRPAGDGWKWVTRMVDTDSKVKVNFRKPVLLKFDYETGLLRLHED